MESIYYIGLDVHKKTIAYCIKSGNGAKVRQGVIAAERQALRQWLSELSGYWLGALEATIFTGWIYVCHAELSQPLVSQLASCPVSEQRDWP